MTETNNPITAEDKNIRMTFKNVCSAEVYAESKKLEERIKEVRAGEKVDDGTKPNQCFDPMKTHFSTQEEPGQDLTEDLEVRD